MDTNRLWALIEDWRLWAICGTALGLGTIGGAIQAISSLPWAEAKKVLPARMLVGAIAAVAAIYITEPKSDMAFIGGALVAGYAGQAILSALEARAMLTVAKTVAATQQQLADKTVEVAKAERDRNDAIALARERGALMQATDRILADPTVVVADAALPPLARIETARAMLGAIRRPTMEL